MKTSCTQKLISHAEERESTVISLERVAWNDVTKYGVAEVGDDAGDGACFPVQDLIEKPTQEKAPSNLAITGRYVFTSKIFDRLMETEPGVDDEMQLTDAIRELDRIHGVELSGDRYDIGNIPSWFRANIDMALHHDDGEMNDAVEAIIEEYNQ